MLGPRASSGLSGASIAASSERGSDRTREVLEGDDTAIASEDWSSALEAGDQHVVGHSGGRVGASDGAGVGAPRRAAAPRDDADDEIQMLRQFDGPTDSLTHSHAVAGRIFSTGLQVLVESAIRRADASEAGIGSGTGG